MSVDVTWALQWARRTAELVAQHRDELVELDRQIGDGDHGENLDRGFRAVLGRLDGLEEPPGQVGEVLRVVATTLMSTVGGAAGPLYGTAYLRAAKVTGLETLDGAAVLAMLEAGLEGIVARGRAQAGEKTMVDAWSAAVGAATEAVARGSGPEEVLAVAARAADEGAQATVPMVATKGRASYLGERSAGHLDPGARSSALLLRAAAEVAGVALGDDT